MADNDKLSVTIHKCEFDTHEFTFRPNVSIYLVDARSGDAIIKNTANDAKIATTNPSITFNHKTRPISPIWEENLTCNYNFNELSSKLLMLFDIRDLIHRRTSGNQEDISDINERRLAWAFLKPVASDGSLNVGKPIRLQLFKVRRKCKISHQTCPIFHLYSDHERKKYPGTLTVTLRGMPASSTEEPSVNRTRSQDTSKGKPVLSKSESVDAPRIEVAKWSRLPTQSCKLPNNKVAEFTLGNRGASCLAFSHSGLMLACGSVSRIIIFDILSKKIVAKLSGHTGLVYELSWHHDDGLILSLSADCTGMIWSAKNLNSNPVYILPHPSFVYCGKWFKDCDRLVTGGKDRLLRVWAKNSQSFEIQEEHPGHEGYVTAIETSGQSFMCSGDSTGTVLLWNVSETEWQIIRTLKLKEIVGAVVSNIHLHPGQRRIVVTARTRGAVMVDVVAGVVVQTYKARAETARSTTCLTPCGTTLLTFSPCSNVYAWEFDSGRHQATYSNIFPVFSDTAQLTGSITYHPYEHMLAISVFGCSCPVVILQYDWTSDMSNQLGLTFFEGKAKSAEKTSRLDAEKEGKRVKSKDEKESGSTTEEKLAAIVRNIDRVLAVKRQLSGHSSSVAK